MPMKVNKICLIRKSYYLGGVDSIALTSDNNFIASGAEDGSVKIFNLITKEEAHSFGNPHQGK